jgi:hypothetical protein
MPRCLALPIRRRELGAACSKARPLLDGPPLQFCVARRVGDSAIQATGEVTLRDGVPERLGGGRVVTFGMRPKTLRRILLLMVGAVLLAMPTTNAVSQSAVDHFYAAGDISPEPNVATTFDIKTSDSILAGLQTHPSAVVLPLGDTQYLDGALAKYQSATGYSSSWGRSAVLGRTCAATGNHEYRTPHAAGFFAYLGPRAKICAQSGRPDLGYYAFKRPSTGTWVYVLSSDCGREPGGGSPSCANPSPQLNWFIAHLDAHRNDPGCKIAIWHHPRFATKAPFPDDAVVASLWNAFAHRGGNLVLVGHNHVYERFTSMTTTGVPGTGPREIIVGTGGGNGLNTFQTAFHAGSRFHDNKHFGVLHLTLTTTGWSSERIRTDGVIDDRVGAGC